MWGMTVSCVENSSGRVGWRWAALALVGCVAGCMAIGGAAARAGEAETPSGAGALISAYPDFLAGVEGGDIVWRDGTRMPFGAARDGHGGEKSAELRLADPSLADMLAEPYPAGAPLEPPSSRADPGRARMGALFDKMYGACAASEGRLVEVVWLPRKWGKSVKFAAANGAAAALAKVSAELDSLPASFDPFLFPPAGTVNCRTIAGTSRRSAHAWGIAIDIATRHAHYWRWGGKAVAAADDWEPVQGWRNAIPAEIVAAFEKHGFVWGGRWAHYDTMHFEYRPELVPASR